MARNQPQGFSDSNFLLSGERPSDNVATVAYSMARNQPQGFSDSDFLLSGERPSDNVATVAYSMARNQATQFSEFLAEVLLRVPALQIVLTSRERATQLQAGNESNDLNEKVVQITGLKPLDAAELFAKMMPRPLTMFEMNCGIQDGRGWKYALGNGSILRRLEGQPGLIAKTVPYLVDMNLLVKETAILDLIDNLKQAQEDRTVRIPPTNLRYHIFDNVSLPEIWMEISQIDVLSLEMPPPVAAPRLQSKFSSARSESLESLEKFTQTPLEWIQLEKYIQIYFQKEQRDAELRPLDQSDLLFLKSSRKIWEVGRQDFAPARNGNKVHFKGFETFWNWFQAQVLCISRCGLWPITEPAKILRAFTNQETAASLLMQRPRGTFIVRLSESVSFSFTISVVEHPGYVNNVRVNVDSVSNSCQTTVAGQIVQYRSLTDLILRINFLTKFYGNPERPDVDKHELRNIFVLEADSMSQ